MWMHMCVCYFLKIKKSIYVLLSQDHIIMNKQMEILLRKESLHSTDEWNETEKKIHF